MRVVIPLSPSDAEILQPFIDALVHFKCLDNHYVTIVPTASAIPMAEQVERAIRDFCPNVEIQPMPYDPMGGHPKACNTQFAFAAQRLDQLRNTLPWFWMEPDCIPVQKFWADKLANEYARVNKPFLGWVNVMKNKDPQGVWRESKTETMMMGCAIYPPDFMRRERVRTLWKDLGQVASSTPEPFDKYLRYAFTSENGGQLAHTPLIGDRWRTKNYREDFSCDNANTANFGWDHSTQNVSSAVVIHGVKDGSLTKVVMKGAVPPAPKPETAIDTAPSLPSNDRLTALENKLDKLISSLFSARQSETPKTAAPSIDPTAEGSTTEEKEAGGKHCAESGSKSTQTGHISVEQVVEILSKSDKKLRAGDIARDHGVSISDLREMAKDPACPFDVNGPLGWVSLKEVTV